MKNDNRDFNSARRKKHDEDFPTQERIERFLPNRAISDGETIELGGLKFEIIAKPTNESEMSTLLYLPEYKVLFTGDLVNNKVTPAPFESVENWIKQLTEISQKLPNLKTLYLGHGKAGAAQPLIAEQLEYLKLLHDSVKEELEKNGRVTPTGSEAIIKKIETKYPDYAGAAALQRRELLKMDIEFISEQLKDNKTENKIETRR